MKKINVILTIGFIALGLGITGCVNQPTVTIPKDQYDSLTKVKPINDTVYTQSSVKPMSVTAEFCWLQSDYFKLVIIDSCEYIGGYTQSYHGGPIFTHSGNCKHCWNKLKALLTEAKR